MTAEAARNIKELMIDGTEIDKAVEAGAREAIRIHKLAGLPLVVWRNGRVEKVPPDFFDHLLGDDLVKQS